LHAALPILLIGFATSQRALMGVGVIALLAALSHYYYTLATTLLAKSGALFATALVLLAVWYGLRLAAAADEDRHA
jgi:uncharacterized membrane protein